MHGELLPEIDSLPSMRLERERQKRLSNQPASIEVFTKIGHTRVSGQRDLSSSTTVSRLMKDLLKHSFDPQPEKILQILIREQRAAPLQEELNFCKSPVGNAGQKSFPSVSAKLELTDRCFDLTSIVTNGAITMLFAEPQFVYIYTLVCNGDIRIFP